MGSPIPPVPQPVPPIVPIDTSGPIRRFVDSHIQADISAAVAQLDPGAHGAVIAFADENSMRLATVARKGEHWTTVMVGERTWKGAWSAQASVRYQW